MKHGYNLSGSWYADGCGLFINRLYDSAITGNKTALGYPTGAIGSYTEYVLLQSNAYEWSQFKPGVYKAVGKGTGHRVTLSGYGLTTVTFDTVLGVDFSVPITRTAMAAPTGDDALTFANRQYLKLSVANLTGAVIPDFNITTHPLGVVHADDEAAFAVGTGTLRLTADYAASGTTASKGPVRPMSLMQTIAGWVKDVSDIPVDGSVDHTNFFITYPGVTYDPSSKYRVHSPEMHARTAIESGNPLWVSLWPMMTDAALTAYFTRLAAAYPEGDLWVEGSNEIWNFAYTSNSGFLASEYGKPENQNTGVMYPSTEPSLIAAMGKNAAHFSFRCYRAADAAFGRARVKRTVNCQLGWIDASMSALDAVCPPGFGAMSGLPLGKVMDAACVAAYTNFAPDDLSALNGFSGAPNTGRGIKGTFDVGGIDTWNSSGFNRRQLLENGVSYDTAYTGFSAGAWSDKAHKNSVDNTANLMVQWQVALATKGYSPLRYVYEGAMSHDDTPSFGYQGYTEHGPNGVGYLFACNPATGAFSLADGMPPNMGATLDGTHTFTDTAKTLSALYSDGDLVSFGWNDDFPVKLTYPCRVISGALYIFRNDDGGASYATGTIGAAYKPVGITATKVIVTNITRLANHHRNVMTKLWANTAEDGTGVTVMDYLHDKYVAAGISHSAGFIMVGSATNCFADYTGTKPWAYKPNGLDSPDTGLLTWVKTKT